MLPKSLEYVCWDIKYVWVQGERLNYYLLSVIDVFSPLRRTGKILAWLFQGSIRQIDLINLLRRVNLTHELKGVILRNDSGSQFIAHSVRNFLKSLEVKQEFTHVATPKENSYIEAFHSILEHDVIDRNEFESYYEAKEMLQRYFSHYNYYRLHRSIGFVTPQQKWDETEVVFATTFLENLSN